MGEFSPRCVLVIHGGAGVLPCADATPEREASLHEARTAALQAGERILQTNGTSLDAVSTAIRVLEDSPSFNAARPPLTRSADSITPARGTQTRPRHARARDRAPRKNVRIDRPIQAHCTPMIKGQYPPKQWQASVSHPQIAH